MAKSSNPKWSSFQVTERASPLSETQINAIIEDSRVRIDTSGQAAALAPEIRRCVEELTPIPEALEQ